jgi:hypothetical protein
MESSLRIGRNDPTLAAAAAAAAIAQGEAAVRCILPRLGMCSLRQGAALLRARYPSGLLQEFVRRANGSRAHARFAVLAPLGGRLELMVFRYDARRSALGGQPWTVHRPGVVVTAHAAARLAQRATGTAVLPALAAEARLHVVAVAAWLEDHQLEAATELVSTDGRGVVVWCPKNQEALAVTYLQAAKAADPAVRNLAAKARETQGAVMLLARPVGGGSEC